LRGDFHDLQCTVFAKGRVENSIGYVQKNFLNGLQISSLETLNAQVRRWMEQVANVRVHRETGERPKPTLQPLPLAGYDISCSRRVRATTVCRVAFESNRYTVPFEHAGALLKLLVTPQTIAIFRVKNLSHSTHATTDATRTSKILITSAVS
jgi:hypothetical protein